MSRFRRQSRSATVLVVALVCLLIALSITTTMVTETLAHRVQLQFELSARQAALLVQAGRGRAAARLAADPEYAGERWTPEVSDGKRAVVAIAAHATDDNATQFTVVATYPVGDPKAVRRSHVFRLTPKTAPSQE